MRVMLKSKIHRACVTDCDINYEGSISIDTKLMEAADILPFEQVHVLDIDNGARLVTYAIEGEDGEIGLNGAAARLVHKGDNIIILTYCHVNNDEAGNYTPKLVYVNEKNVMTSAPKLAGTITV